MFLVFCFGFFRCNDIMETEDELIKNKPHYSVLWYQKVPSFTFISDVMPENNLVIWFIH